MCLNRILRDKEGEYTPGQKYKGTLKNKEKYIVYNF